MKKIILTLLAAAFAVAVLSFKSEEKVLAEPEQLQGLYVFTDSKPVSKFKYLGTVKRNTGGFGGAQYTDVRDGLIKRCKADYPEANGIMLILSSGAADRADAIKIENGK